MRARCVGQLNENLSSGDSNGTTICCVTHQQFTLTGARGKGIKSRCFLGADRHIMICSCNSRGHHYCTLLHIRRLLYQPVHQIGCYNEHEGSGDDYHRPSPASEPGKLRALPQQRECEGTDEQ